MIDSHCHLDSDELGRDPEVVAAEARAVGVSDIVMAGVDPSGWAAQRALAVRIPNVHTVFGIHPQMIPSYDCESLEAAYIALEAAITTARPVALGELGLDRLSDATKASIDVQGNAFREQLRMAKRFDLPIVLHLLRADEPALKILREEGVPAAGGVVHSFSGSAEYAQQLLKLGLLDPVGLFHIAPYQTVAVMVEAVKKGIDKSPHEHQGTTFFMELRNKICFFWSILHSFK